MSFASIKNTDAHSTHPRICVVLSAFSPAELKQLKNVARLTGIGEQIIIDGSYNATKVLDLLENPSLTPVKTENISTQKAILFNNVPANRMNAFIESMKKCRIPRPLIAVVTETSIHWTIEELISNLAAERIALKNNQTTLH